MQQNATKCNKMQQNATKCDKRGTNVDRVELILLKCFLSNVYLYSQIYEEGSIHACLNTVDCNSLLLHLLKRISRLLLRERRSKIVSAVE